MDSSPDPLELLLDAAQLQVRIRKTFAAVKRDPSAKYFVYVLELQGGVLYVGTTDNIYTRLLDHFTMSPSSAVWVREHGPVSRVLEIVRNAGADDENYKTLEFMSLFGWERVRGGAWCKGDMRGPPLALPDFRRTRADFDYLTRDEVDDVTATVQALARMI